MATRPILANRPVKPKRVADTEQQPKPKKKRKDPTKPTYQRTYTHDANGLNGVKAHAVLDLFCAYIACAKNIKAQQIHRFFVQGVLDKNAIIQSGNTKTLLSARYQQTCQYQVVAMLSSWVALRQTDFERLVWHSTIEGDLRQELLQINRRKSWFKPSTEYSAQALRLAQNIMRHLFKVHRLPDVRYINLALDEKVAAIETAKANSHFRYWLKLSTLEANKPIYLPLSDNPFCSDKGGVRKKFLQLNLSEDKGLTVGLIKEFEQKNYQPRCDVLGLDVGLSVFFATSQGELLGNQLFEKLKKLDQRIQSYASERQRQGFKQVRTAKYAAFVARVRGLLECELNRILNDIVHRIAPKELVLEHLDFRNPNLSRRMNRLITNFGRGVVKEKLQALQEEYGLEVTFVPAAYTSQACPNCNHTEKDNRLSRDLFQCKHCGFKRHADVVGALNIASRRSWPGIKADKSNYLRREAVQSYLRSKHHGWCFQSSKVRKQHELTACANRSSNASSGRSSAPRLLQPPTGKARRSAGSKKDK